MCPALAQWLLSLIIPTCLHQSVRTGALWTLDPDTDGSPLPPAAWPLALIAQQGPLGQGLGFSALTGMQRRPLQVYHPWGERGWPVSPYTSESQRRRESGGFGFIKGEDVGDKVETQVWFCSTKRHPSPLTSLNISSLPPAPKPGHNTKRNPADGGTHAAQSRSGTGFK